MITKNELKILFTDEQLGDLAKIVGDHLVSNSIGLEQKKRQTLLKQKTSLWLLNDFEQHIR